MYVMFNFFQSNSSAFKYNVFGLINSSELDIVVLSVLLRHWFSQLLLYNILSGYLMFYS